MKPRNSESVPVTFAKPIESVEELLNMHINNVYARNYVYNGKNPLPCMLRMNSKIKTWKRDPNRIRFSLKYGMYDVIEVTSLAQFNRDFSVSYERIES